ncbi:3de59456-b246-4a05-a3ac-ba32ee720084 [Sclerotinia trifoliorum]|uniref:3de59456-b246-4a05-a3ac-ba32ee720084 n=1 Tax=Sclerotinia trifoliorum TaxID=28548 RepID=A0A8H2W4P5_9HELO|nr:3de59456-b246-4a05-a3ac-ba32ee720084 [Sclerotinia trifoliorum]
MSSMLRKGGKSFKPSARPRPNAPRPSSSQPATRPSSEIQSQTPVSASQPSNPIPALVRNVTEKEPSETTISTSAQLTPQSHPTPQAQPQPSSTTSNNDDTAIIDSTAKRKVREDEVGTDAELEQPPTKARKLTPPPDEVQPSEINAPSQTVPVVSTGTHESVPASSNTQGPIQPSRIEEDHTSGIELLSIGHSITDNATNEESVPAKSIQSSSDPSSTIRAEISRINTTIDQGRGPGQVFNRAIQTPPESSVDFDLSGMGADEASQASHLVSTAIPTSDEISTPVDGEVTPTTKKPRKKAAPRKKKAQVEDGGELRTDGEIQLNRPRDTGGQARERRKKDSEAARKRKDREATPEDAENEVIEPTVMKMADLCKDIRIGKKFSKHDELKLRHVRKKIDAQLAERPELAGLVNIAPAEINAESRVESAEAPAAIVNNNGLQMRVIDGQIVLDDQSLQVDRHRQARNQGQVLEEIEENEFTRAVNSGQYMKRAPAVRWDSNSNELFYQGLRQFGTAFEMIAAMFPDRNRRQIKLKFVREERQNPAKVDRALKGKTDEIDFEEYTQLTGQKFEDSADIQAEHQRLEDEHNAEEEKAEAAKAAADRKKKEAISNAVRRGKSDAGGASDGEDGPESQKENAGAALTGNGKRKPSKSKKSNKASMQGGGEEIEILGTV